MRTRVLIYGGLLAAGALVLQVLDYQRFALGVGVGMRIASPPAPPFDGNPKAVAALGISARELEVLELIATGRTTQEIADRLGLSPNTVKTHVNRLFEKLEASKRIEAVQKARELGIVR